jgi:hypothetical protein
VCADAFSRVGERLLERSFREPDPLDRCRASYICRQAYLDVVAILLFQTVSVENSHVGNDFVLDEPV